MHQATQHGQGHGSVVLTLKQEQQRGRNPHHRAGATGLELLAWAGLAVAAGGGPRRVFARTFIFLHPFPTKCSVFGGLLVSFLFLALGGEPRVLSH